MLCFLFFHFDQDYNQIRCVNNYREEGGHWSHSECPAFCSSVLEDQEGVTYQTEYFWGWYDYLGMHFHVDPDGTGNSHSVFWNSLDSMDLLELLQSSCPLVVIILQMCQENVQIRQWLYNWHTAFINPEEKYMYYFSVWLSWIC